MAGTGFLSPPVASDQGIAEFTTRLSGVLPQQNPGKSCIRIAQTSMGEAAGAADNGCMYYGERLNGYTHLAGTVLATGGAALLVSTAAAKGDPLRLTSISIYCATLLVVYLASTFYHSTRGPLKAVFRKLDHTAIYLLIAGSYTPFALVTLKGAEGWTLFAASWGLALVGILQELWLAKGRRLTSLVIYVMMGWMGLLVIQPLIHALTWDGFTWLLAAGGVYTGGLIFYLFDERFRHWHGIWHVCVMLGSGLHFAAVLKFVA